MRATRFKNIVLPVILILACFVRYASAGTTIGYSDVVQNPTPFIPRGGGWIPAGYNPFGYKITPLGNQFLKYDGSLESDIGRLLTTLKSGRKRFTTIKEQWLEVMRISKSGQNMRIYRMLRDMLEFCVKAGLVD